MNCDELEKVFNEHGKKIYSFCLKLTNDKDTAQDLYQNTFLKAIEIKDKIKFESAKNYLIGISINLWKNQKRKLAIRNKIASFISINDESYKEKRVDNMSIEEEYIKKEEKNSVLKVIESLNDKHRVVVLMYYNLELSICEISTILKVSQGTVKSRLHTARKIIRESLKEEILCENMKRSI